MKTLLAFIIGVAVGVAAHSYLFRTRTHATLDGTRGDAGTRATDVSRAVKKDFDPAAIKDELARTGKVIREKARQAGDTIGNAAADARITGAIKAKLVEDSGLSAFKIDVDTNDGMVTLSGSVRSHEEIDRAVNLALETEGVQKVVSTLQVKVP